VGLINLRVGDATTDSIAHKIYATLQAEKVEVLYDDRDERSGAKFADMDLIGLPWQVIVGPKDAVEDKVEIKNRKSGIRYQMRSEEAIAFLIDNIPRV
jgi:prolyl-tRNA synthetase